MKKRRKVSQTGLAILLAYLVIVIVLELVRALTSVPVVAWLASSPDRLADGQWWRLGTSAFVVDGPPVPQVVVTALLGGLIIWFRGSWLFWAIAVAGHVFGTLLTYVGLVVGGILGAHGVHHFLTAPDYGISLVWSSALGALAAAAWLGPDLTWTRAYRPVLVSGAFGIMFAVVILSRGDDALQHAIAFAVGAILIAVVDRSGEVSRHPALKRAA